MQAVDVYNVCFPKDLVARETPRADSMDIVQAQSTSCISRCGAISALDGCPVGSTGCPDKKALIPHPTAGASCGEGPWTPRHRLLSGLLCARGEQHGERSTLLSNYVHNPIQSTRDA